MLPWHSFFYSHVIKIDSSTVSVTILLWLPENCFLPTDSIEVLATTRADAGMMYTTMINSFRTVLNEKKTLKNVRSSVAADKTPLMGADRK